VTVADIRVPTRFLSSGRLAATVPASLLDRVGTLPVRVVNPAGLPRGGVSDAQYLIVRFR
jgi:hypothetical protein